MINTLRKLSLAKCSLYGMVLFYLAAGVNHFVSPEFYYGLIPDYLPWKQGINVGSGVLEIAFALILLSDRYRRMGGLLICLLLLVFMLSHVYFIQIGSCIEDGLCVPQWVAWVRLIIIHPVLLYWAYWVGFRYRS